MDECRKQFDEWFKALYIQRGFVSSKDELFDAWQAAWQAAWNRRADSAALAAQNRELREALLHCKEKAHKPEFIYQITKTALALPDLSTEPLAKFKLNTLLEVQRMMNETPWLHWAGNLQEMVEKAKALW